MINDSSPLLVSTRSPVRTRAVLVVLNTSPAEILEPEYSGYLLMNWLVNKGVLVTEGLLEEVVFEQGLYEVSKEKRDIIYRQSLMRITLAGEHTSCWTSRGADLPQKKHRRLDVERSTSVEEHTGGWMSRGAHQQGLGCGQATDQQKESGWGSQRTARAKEQPDSREKAVSLRAPPYAESYVHSIKLCTPSPRPRVIRFFQYPKAPQQ
ncbi:uncharacterized protein LOC126932408 [Macaca thibetana thibetana]|uniref:uncharacterized protein LOC126932408 n=1 Tax=Macaca thibetana thibetana TaxID=257877 RepID=UPI0021BCCD90|nr:uncharacterized protein LOC126932408 [Macaca thibetana thibetana]